MATTVVIRASHPWTSKIFESWARDGILLQQFPGFNGHEQGLLARVERDPAFAEHRSPDEVTVVLSDGSTLNVPKKAVYTLIEEASP